MLKVSRLFMYGLYMAFLLLVLSGCATIFAGTDQDVKFNSTPPAHVVVKGSNGQIVYEGQVPATVKLPKKYTYAVEVSLQGYQTQTVPITQSFNALYLGNILCGGLVGLIIDPITGAMWNLQPNEINITMKTAFNGNNRTYYVVFAALDDQGRVCTVAVPFARI
jgi:hypothetical protein